MRGMSRLSSSIDVTYEGSGLPVGAEDVHVHGGDVGDFSVRLGGGRGGYRLAAASPAYELLVED